jgi:GntR family transcriptional regulator
MSDANLLVRPDRSRPEPLWHQAVQTLSATIEEGIWSPGEQLPGEQQLCEMLGVSRITVRHALRELEARGLILREQGRGTFVRSSRLVAGSDRVTSFSGDMRTLGLTPGSRLLDGRRVLADARTASALELREPGEVLVLERLRTGDGEPVGIQTTHLRGELVPGLDPRDIGDGSLYELLAERFGLVADLASEVYRVGTATAEDADRLAIAEGSPVFVVIRIASANGRPFEFTTSRMRADRFEIRTAIGGR